MIPAAAQLYASSGLSAVSRRLIERLLATKTCPVHETDNLVFSPLCIYSALSLMAAGSRGSTRRELLDVFGPNSDEEILWKSKAIVSHGFARALSRGGPNMAHFSQMWHDATRKVKQDYDVSASRLGCFVNDLDFRTRAEEARKLINTQLAEATRFDSMLHPGSVDKDTRVLHTSYFYFKGTWARPFFIRSRTDYEFHRLDGSVVDAQFMHCYDDQFIATHHGFKVLKIPYTLHKLFDGFPYSLIADAARAMGDEPPPFARYSMCFFVPGERDGLGSLAEKVASSPGFIHDHLPDRRVGVGRFRVPMFKLFSYTNVKQVFQDLGVKTLFTREADLLDMLEDDGSGEPFFVNDMLHKVEVEVSEDSDQPSSDSKLCLIDDAGPEPSSGGADFIIDHPFLFFVVDEDSGAILLAGRITDPSILKLSLEFHDFVVSSEHAYEPYM